MPSITRRTASETTRRTPRQTGPLITTWTFHPSVEDATDIAKGVIDKDALECCDYCDTNDWSQHGKLCASAKERFCLYERPENHVRGIIFGIKSHDPSFIWLDMTNFPLSVAQALGVKIEDVNPPSDINSDIPHRRMYHGVQEYYPYNYSRSVDQDITQFNQSTALVGRPGLMKLHYCSILYCGFRLSRSVKSIIHEDTTMKDFRAIIDFLQITAAEPNNIIVNLKRLPVPGGSNPANRFRPWPAVKINCTADIQRLSCLSDGNRWPLVEDILVPPISSAREPLYLPWLCELPWIGEFLSDDELTTEEKRNYGGRLFAYVFKKGKGGKRRRSLNLYCGSLYVVHADGAPIHPNHILAFFLFAELALTEIQKQITSSSTEWGPESYKFLPVPGHLRRWFTKKKFSEFWEWWINQTGMIKMTYEHNIRGLEWYPFGPFFEGAIPWSPYGFASKDGGSSQEDIGEGHASNKCLDKKGQNEKGIQEYHRALKDLFQGLAGSSMW
ncbi:hypothetical protein M434DRAFT_29315 [Hypoxylon sp. CO27-5]|nr:hypothetical protein M434DRAFT_29315 [Hypoxylon sp. CO27-5]